MKCVTTRNGQKGKYYHKSLWESLLFLTVLIGRIMAKLLDICSFPEFMDFLWQTVKPGTRKLTQVEEQEARKVFGDSINYRKVRIDENSLFAWLGAKKHKCSGMGITSFRTINFNKRIKAAPGNQNMKWLIHELAHVSQMEHVGSRYMIEASYARATEGYGYVLGAKPHFRNYNREQQASIAADYYNARVSGRSTAAYDPYITEMQAGDL
ncbi:hypothetical protein MSHOH_2274 [Methanosarcina horonobensis HB-1 = JCM 15518]|uniref:DUF4157 domain-containing protein n=1 Tax=Methanosarcina horonobensis HB-1 = JCM 15518 TaxID=1434110 RepID=A0A0E3SEW8_9EURY|nr:hypothetical protein [Methanosarcina horonobensis]AKB78757.1 hypothetical protein MSHOH_2274 [Methanosarcina horonobensis HB-1 = JCM 15518]